MKHREQVVARVRCKYVALKPALTERARRLWAAVEAEALGRGGAALVAEATGLARSTVFRGLREVRGLDVAGDVVRERRRGAGRPRVEKQQPKVLAALEALVSSNARGDPESPLRWTATSTVKLADKLRRQGFSIGASKVGELLHVLGFSLQGTFRSKEGKEHVDRDAQFSHINETAKDFISRGLPVVSVDAKKKEAVGVYPNRGREWRPKGKPIRVMAYDYFLDGVPKAIPYGVYDVGANHGFVNVGTDHDTPTFAAHSLERWWELLGKPRYPNATELLITADGGGSNGRKSHMWKARLQQLADKTGLTLRVCHFPPGTSKWNKIEHRLFSFISLNWRGKPLETYETVVALIAGTTTRQGLKVTAELDRAQYPVGISVPPLLLQSLNLERHEFHGEWNYCLRPRSQEVGPEVLQAPSKARSREQRRADWRALFVEQANSGLSQRAFCKLKGIDHSFFAATRRAHVGPLRLRRERSDEEWTELSKLQAQSGLGHRRFCEQNELNFSAYTHARKRLGLIKK